MAKTKRPGLKVNDLVTLRFGSIPAYGGKPFVAKDKVLRVSSVGGTGSVRNPWYATVTDDVGSTWTLPPSDFLTAESSSKRHHVTKKPAQLDREIEDVALEAAIDKARGKAAQSNRRQSIWRTREGELRVRPMFEKVSPLWSLVRHVPSDAELR